MPNQLIQTARRQWAAVQNETIEEANTAGRVGKAGHAILDALEFSTPYIGTNGNWWVGATDTGTPAQGEPGAKGDKGGKGDTGTDGRGIESINTDDNNHLIVKYTDGNLHDAGVMQNRRKLFSFNTADYINETGALPGGYLFRLLEWTPNTYVGSSSGYTQFEKLPNFELNIAMKSDNTNNNAKLTNGKFIFLTAGQYEYDYDLAKPLSDSGYGFIYRFSGNINNVGSQYIIFEAEGYGYPTIAMMVLLRT